jgi:hypothetical protein
MGGIAVRALTSAVGLALILAGAPAANAARQAGVSGRASLKGPCAVPGPRCDNLGVPATIKVVRARSRRLVRTVHTDTGRFRVGLSPGRYRLRATADGGHATGSVRVRVERDAFTSVVVVMHHR